MLRARVVDWARNRPPEPYLTMFAVLWRAGVFLALTGVVYLVCLQLIKMEARREARKRR
jgi:cytochrome c oxidase assembly factor CtaG